MKTQAASSKRVRPAPGVLLPLGVLLLLVVPGCAVPPVRLAEKDRIVAAGDYLDEVAHWTRRGEMYQDFLSRIFAYGTFRGWAFRQAQIAHRADTERLPTEDVERLTARERAESVEAHGFFLAVHTHEWSWNHLERTGHEAIWRLRLLNDLGESVAPLSIQRIGTRDPRFTALYPYYRDFYVGYVVRFPRRGAAGVEILRDGIARFTVRISGPQAVVDLEWEVGGKEAR